MSGAAVAPHIDRGEWLEARKTGIGGTDITKIVGHDEYGNKQSVYDSKVGLADPVLANGDIRRGNIQEPIAADRYVAETGRRIRRQPLRRHREHAFMIANIDRQIISDGRGTGALEVKVPRVANFYKMREEGLPEKHIIQMHWYMHVLDYSWSSFAAYTPEYDDLIYFDVTRDAAVCEWLAREATIFWEEHVEKRVRPRLPGLDVDHPPLPKAPGEALMRYDPEWREAAGAYMKAEQDKQWAEGEYEAAKAALMGLATGGDGEVACFVAGCGVTVKRYGCNGRKSFDRKQLAHDHPEIGIERYQTKSKDYFRTDIRVTVPEEAIP